MSLLRYVVPASAVIGESVVAFEIARAFLGIYEGDSIEQVKKTWEESQYFQRACF